MTKPHKNWIFSKPLDLWILFVPVWISWLVCFLLPDHFLDKTLPLWGWVVFVLAIDVSHVWSTIFRTYLDKEEFKNHESLLIIAPLACFAGLFLIANFSVQWFWRVMAYIALHHFVKQQYGFMAIYRAKFGWFPNKFFNDKPVIYLSMLYPVVFWHFEGNRAFSWFVEGDFFAFGSLTESLPFLEHFWTFFNIVYWLILIGWLIEEIYLARKHQKAFAWGKVLWILSTAFNWYLGIVYFNSDVAFSITNVVAHGIPYMALTFFYVEEKKIKIKKQQISSAQILSHVVTMTLIVLALAVTEEYFWDMLLHREKEPFFEAFFNYPLEDSFSGTFLEAIFLALLSVPQVAHYIIDGFIWKGNAKNPHLKKILL